MSHPFEEIKMPERTFPLAGEETEPWESYVSFADAPIEIKPLIPEQSTKAEMTGQEIKLSWSFDFKYLAIALIVIALLWLVFK